MKFVYSSFENAIVFEENITNVIVVENQKLFYRFVNDLDTQLALGNGELIVSDLDKIIDISKMWFMFINPFDFSSIQKKITTKLFSKIKELSVNEDYLLDTASLKNQVFEYFEKIFDSFSIPLTYNEEMDMSLLCKSVDVQPLIEAGSYLEKLLLYLDLLQEFLSINTIVFVNLKSYLDEEDLRALYNFANYKKIHLLLVESVERDLLETEKRLIIDKDLCQI